MTRTTRSTSTKKTAVKAATPNNRKSKRLAAANRSRVGVAVVEVAVVKQAGGGTSNNASNGKKKKIHYWKGVNITTLNYQEILDDLEKLSKHKMHALAGFFEIAQVKCKDDTKLTDTDKVRENLRQFLMFMLEHPACDGMKGLEIEELDEHPEEDLLFIITSGKVGSERRSKHMKKHGSHVVVMNKARHDKSGGTPLYRAKNLDPSQHPIKITKKYVIVPDSLAGQTECNSRKLCKKLDISLAQGENEKNKNPNTLACQRLDNWAMKAGLEKHAGMVRGYNNAFTDTGHEHQARIYCHFGKLDDVGFYDTRLAD